MTQKKTLLALVNYKITKEEDNGTVVFTISTDGFKETQFTETELEKAKAAVNAFAATFGLEVVAFKEE